MQIAVCHPQLVEKLVLASSFYQRDGLFAGFFDFMETASLDNMPKQLQEEFLKLTPDKDKLQVMHDRDKNRMLAFKDWSDDLIRSINMPVLLITGDKDVMTLEHTLKMYRLFPNAQLAILPGTHGAYLGEITTVVADSKQTEITAILIKEFLLSLEFRV
jgi:pimeloyl-ACP methyl ester carboxylesterase